jgi:hypothetical protein
LLSFDDLWERAVNENDAGKEVAHDRWYPFLASVFGTTVYVPALLADYRQHGANVYGVSWFRVRAPALTELWHSTRAANQRSQAARSRAEILRCASERLDGEWRCRALAGVEYFNAVARQFTTRADLYEGPSIGKRLKAFASFWTTSGHRRAVAPVLPAALALDVTVGVPKLFRPIRRLLDPLSRD